MQADASNRGYEMKSTHALQAVIKLHKLQEITLPDGSWGQNCQECDNRWGLCSTMQTIKKALQ